MPRVLICDKLEAAGVELLTAAGIEVDNRPGLTGDALRDALRAIRDTYGGISERHGFFR